MVGWGASLAALVCKTLGRCSATAWAAVAVVVLMLWPDWCVRWSPDARRVRVAGVSLPNRAINEAGG